MRKNLFLLGGVIVLYLLTSLVLYGIYGPSVGLFQGEDSWRPDGQGGRAAHGSPGDPRPEVPSINVPAMVLYLPVI